MDQQILQNINSEKINNKFLLNRLLRESVNFSTYFKSLSLTYSDNKYLLYVEDKLNYKYNKYCFILNENYPFAHPTLKINDILYKDFLMNGSLKYRKVFEKMAGLKCLCCDNILCNNIWSPAITLIKIVDQINLFRSYKKNIVYKIMSDKIKDKYLISDIDIESWLF